MAAGVKTGGRGRGVHAGKGVQDERGSGVNLGKGFRWVVQMTVFLWR